MSAWTINIIGVYPLPFSEEILRQIVAELSGKSPDQMDPDELRQRCDMWRSQARDTMSGLHLLELEVSDELTAFPVGQLSQDSPQTSESQVPYDEVWLDIDGRATYGGSAPAQVNTARLLFWLHCVDFAKPLHTPGGPMSLLKPSPMPDRLRTLVRYTLP